MHSGQQGRPANDQIAGRLSRRGEQKAAGESTMTDLMGYARRIEEEDLPRLRQSLAPLESGQTRLGSRGEGDTEWRDVTAEHVAMLKRAITTYETILVRLRGMIAAGGN